MLVEQAYRYPSDLLPRKVDVCSRRCGRYVEFEEFSLSTGMVQQWKMILSKEDELIHIRQHARELT